MLALIPLLPFLGFLINAFLGRRLAKSVSGGVACAAMLAAFAVSAMASWRRWTSPMRSRKGGRIWNPRTIHPSRTA